MFTSEIHNFHQLLNTQVLGLMDPVKKANTGIEIANDSLSKLKEIVDEWANLKVESFENRRSWVRASKK